MLAVLIGQAAGLLRPDAPALAAVLAVTALLVAALVVAGAAARTSTGRARVRTAGGFAALRPLLGATEPNAAGHPMARAPGAAH